MATTPQTLAIYERAGNRCECTGECGRHKWRCVNTKGQLAEQSRFPVRLAIFKGQLMCQGCRARLK